MLYFNVFYNIVQYLGRYRLMPRLIYFLYWALLDNDYIIDKLNISYQEHKMEKPQ